MLTARIKRTVLLSMSLLAVLASGCATIRSLPLDANRESDGQTLVWPGPPSPPRIRYIKDIEKPRDLRIKPSPLALLAQLVTGETKRYASFVRPFGVSFDSDENICMTDPGAGAVYFFDLKKMKVKRWVSIGKVQFASPVSVVKNGRTIYVADTALQSIVIFDTSGKLLGEIGQRLRRPCGLALSEDRLFVADAHLHRVLVFDLQGRFLTQFGTRGAGPGEFNFPTHVAIDSKGQIYVTDAMNFRVQVFSREGRFVRSIGAAGDTSGHFTRPKGVALDAHDNAYVVDALFDNVQIFNREGQFLLHWGTRGGGPGEFWLPADIAISRSGHVIISDTYNRRLQVFRHEGEEL